MLRNASLTDHTDKVRHDGIVELRFDTKSTRHLFAYYQYQDLAKNLDIETNTTESIFDNGSYIVDHFSTRGAQTTIDFWEKHILNDSETRQLLSEVGKYAWEDSIEIESKISWTPSLPEKFQQVAGYDIRKYLPLIQFGNNNPGVQPSYPGDIQCVLDTQDAGQGVVNDYREALAQGYQEYLNTIKEWTSPLGLEYSAQISYNLPLDMEASIAHADGPECESLAFNDNIDGYRQFSGVANVAQKGVISNEMGADIRTAFRLSVAHLLWQINRAFAGGVNQIVLHGQTYSGNYYDTTWPGYASFFMLFGESYNDKQPAWQHSYPDMIAHASRNQFVLRQGMPRTDVAFLNKDSVTDPQLGTVYAGSDLVDAGYTYSYLSPDNQDMDDIRVENGLLAPGSPAYRAIVVARHQNVTLESVKKLQQFAQAGLPVILSGGLPGYYPSGNASDTVARQRAVTTALHSLQRTENVYTTGTHQVSQRLTAIGIHPRVRIQTNGTWYPVYRTDNATDIDYVFLFSESTSKALSKGTITVQTTKRPYILNSWSGNRSPVVHYQVNNNGTITIPLTLAANQTTVLAFSSSLKNKIDTPATNAVYLPDSVIGYNYTKTAGLALHVSTSHRSSNSTVQLSNGKAHHLPVSSSPAPSVQPGGSGTKPFKLSNWTLTAEHWTAPANLSHADIPAVKHNTTHSFHGTFIPSWLDIAGLKNVSGVGYYRAGFQWDTTATAGSNGSNIGAYISLPAVSHGLRVYINGHRLEGIDLNRPLADMGPYLTSGVNVVDVIVPTVMWNYIRGLYGDIEIAGSAPLLTTTGPLSSLAETGLIGEVEVWPYVVSWVDV